MRKFLQLFSCKYFNDRYNYRNFFCKLFYIFLKILINILHILIMLINKIVFKIYHCTNLFLKLSLYFLHPIYKYS